MNRKLVFNILFFAAAIGLGLTLSSSPWQVYRHQRQSADVAEKIKERAERDREDLTRKKAQYDSELGKEELARNHSFRQVNETPVQDKIQAND
jgi:hypothetical protein